RFNSSFRCTFSGHNHSRVTRSEVHQTEYEYRNSEEHGNKLQQSANYKFCHDILLLFLGFRIQSIAKTISEEVKCEYYDNDHHTREECNVCCLVHVVTSVVKHSPPLRSRRLYT